MLGKDSFIENLYTALSCLIKHRSFLTLCVSIYFRMLAVLFDLDPIPPQK